MRKKENHRKRKEKEGKEKEKKQEAEKARSRRKRGKKEGEGSYVVRLGRGARRWVLLVSRKVGMDLSECSLMRWSVV